MLKRSKELRKELDSLWSDMCHESVTKVLLILSLTTDKMIRCSMMHPEVLFMDVKGQTNRQKKDLFLAAVKDSEGKVFPGNITMMPSGRAWVFMAIFQLAFLHLCAKETLKMICLGLTDEDPAEFGSFENCIETMEECECAKLMLCVFHAVCKPFKEKICPLLQKAKGSVSE